MTDIYRYMERKNKVYLQEEKYYNMCLKRKWENLYHTIINNYINKDLRSIPDTKIQLIKKLYDGNFGSYTKIAKEVGVERHTVSKIINRF